MPYVSCPGPALMTQDVTRPEQAPLVESADGQPTDTVKPVSGATPTPTPTCTPTPTSTPKKPLVSDSAQVRYRAFSFQLALDPVGAQQFTEEGRQWADYGQLTMWAECVLRFRQTVSCPTVMLKVCRPPGPVPKSLMPVT